VISPHHLTLVIITSHLKTKGEKKELYFMVTGSQPSKPVMVIRLETCLVLLGTTRQGFHARPYVGLDFF
jgi:hypothetical protein